jgi:hypothetical protein
MKNCLKIILPTCYKTYVFFFISVKDAGRKLFSKDLESSENFCILHLTAEKSIFHGTKTRIEFKFVQKAINMYLAQFPCQYGTRSSF